MTPEQEARRAAHERKGVLLMQAYIDTYEWLNARLDDGLDGPVDYEDAVIVVPVWQGDTINRAILAADVEPGTFEAHRAAWAISEGLVAGGNVKVMRRGRFDPDEWCQIGTGYGVFLDCIKYLERVAAEAAE